MLARTRAGADGKPADVRAAADPAARRDRSRQPAIDIDLAALIYTSGSTGTPKGVMLTHLNIVSAATSITTYLENTLDDVILNVLPLSFDYGLYQVLMAFKVGATLVLERSFTYPHAVLRDAGSRAGHRLPDRADDCRAAAADRICRGTTCPALRYITNTAAALPPEHIAELRALCPHGRSSRCTA